MVKKNNGFIYYYDKYLRVYWNIFIIWNYIGISFKEKYYNITWKQNALHF